MEHNDITIFRNWDVRKVVVGIGDESTFMLYVVNAIANAVVNRIDGIADDNVRNTKSTGDDATADVVNQRNLCSRESGRVYVRIRRVIVDKVRINVAVRDV